MKKTLLFLSVLLTASMNAQIVEFTATDDVYVKGGDDAGVNLNLDGGVENPILEVKIGGNADFFRRTLVQFDLRESGLSGEDIENARLRLSVADVQKKTDDPATITVSGTTDDWEEGTVVWGLESDVDTSLHAPVSGTALSSVVGITGTDRPSEDGDGSDGAVKYWDVKSFVVAEVDGDQIISFVLEDLGAANNTITFSSKGGANAPTLIINDPSLGTSDLEVANNAISLYPNPAQDAFVIETANAEISNVKVFSINGSMLYNVNNVNSKSLTVDTSAFQTGVYFVHIKNALGALSVQKIIKN